MKKTIVVLIVMLTAGCAGMESSGSSSGASNSGHNWDHVYPPNGGPVFERMDSSFNPYFGG